MTHEMELVKEHETGAKEFHCPDCGRCLLVDWRDGEKPTTVLEPGNERAIHSAGLGGLSVCDVSVMDKAMYDFWSNAISKLKGELYES